MTEALHRLMEAARHAPFREGEREAQRRSFAYGNTHIGNERVTREMVDEQADLLSDELRLNGLSWGSTDDLPTRF